MSGEDLKGCTPGWCACGHCDPGPVTAPVHPGGERWIVDGGDGCTTEFDTEAEAVAYADACIQDWCDEGWMEEVDNIFVARLTHRSQRQVVAVQGEVSDEEWERVTHGGSGYSEWWDYTIEPVGSTPQAPTVDSDDLGPWCCYAEEVGYPGSECSPENPIHDPSHCGYDNVRRGLAPAPTVDSVPDAVKLLADLANDGGTESIPSVDVCGFCWDSECDGIGCIANLDPDCADDHPKIERLHALLRAGHALRAAAGVDWNDERDAAATGCGYYPATPSPVLDSERPDTEELRSLASFMESDDDARLIRAAADWIESAGWMWIKPAADQGPDLSEAVALLDEYDQSVHNLTRFGTVEAQTDHLLASERVAAFARRLLDREGGTQ